MSLLDTAITLALPYNHDPGYPAWLDAQHEGVSEVYLPIHGSIAPTARFWTGPEDRRAYQDALGPLAAVMDDRGIDANIVLNMPVWTDGREAVVPEVAGLVELFGDRTQVTVADYPLARDLRTALPDLRLCVSTAVAIVSPRGARLWVEELGVESIVLGRAINKRLDAIAAIRALGPRIKIVLDDLCLPECPSMLSHSMLMAQPHLCTPDRASCFMHDERGRRPWSIAQKDVVPATLPLYDGLVDVAKMDGRMLPLEAIDQRRRLYLEATSYEHVAEHYVEPVGAFEKITTCGLSCGTCDWCDRWFPPAQRSPPEVATPRSS